MHHSQPQTLQSKEKRSTAENIRLQNTTTAHWNLYTDNTHSYFAQDTELHRALHVLSPTQYSIDTVWNRFQFNVNLVAEILPYKMSSNITPQRPKNSSRSNRAAYYETL